MGFRALRWFLVPLLPKPRNRRDAFEQPDRPAPGPLRRCIPIAMSPSKRVKVNIDYHVSEQHRHYSVPHQYVGQQLEPMQATHCFRSITSKQLVASHPRKTIPGMSTLPEQYAGTSQQAANAGPQGVFKQRAADIGTEHLALG